MSLCSKLVVTGWLIPLMTAAGKTADSLHLLEPYQPVAMLIQLFQEESFLSVQVGSPPALPIVSQNKKMTNISS